ncbi:endo-1,4-beta-xylanase [Pelagicoccus enzymogenes]|uniref:endo-1,4-beta-xylanase n=1 Tax=Pelagicoccus enzymogenes TaxID=2773457 RepID=UPI00280FB0AA|nr:endo-1,4-beta-xylanase [Pelagicoccus enzymogenes]MDQ8198160.1 endo-1,4-beta-xylanase [Pelagicoccus enzymogenes]
MKKRLPLCSFAIALLAPSILNGQNATAIVMEAENATLGSSFSTATADGVTYITPSVNFTGSAPTSASTVASFSVTFPEAGDYELFARIYVGNGAANDDSFIPANDLGDATVGNSDDWSAANGLWNAGFSDPDEIVLSVGDTGTTTWKWIRVSTFSDVGLLTVPSSQLTQTYKLASREDGLRIDKIAFGPLRVSFTVDQLDNGLAGWDQRQPNDGQDFQATGPILAHGKSKFLGSVWSSTASNNKDFEFYWNGMWHGNGGKWGSVESTRDNMNWSNLDQGYQFAKANSVKFNFHVLLWGAQQPSWISALPPAEQLEEIEEWMSLVANRYPDIDYLQVVNEPINAPPDGSVSPEGGSSRANYIAALGGTGETGFDWILESFRLARHYFPDTPLMINEYNIEGNHDRSDRYLEIIQALQAEDLIDLVGFQGHAFSTKFASSQDLSTILDKIASTGLPIMITEMEIDGHDDYVQLAEYQRVFPIYWDHPSVIGVNISGHIGNWRYDQGAYLVNDNFTERLALQWLREYVADSGWTSFSGYLSKRDLDSQAHAFTNDADGDMLSTGLEFLLGSDPQFPFNEVALLWAWSMKRGELTLPFSPDTGEGKVTIQSSVDLKHWQDEASYDLRFRRTDGMEIVGSDESPVLRFQGNAFSEPALYYRLKFSLPQ